MIIGTTGLAVFAYGARACTQPTLGECTRKRHGTNLCLTAPHYLQLRHSLG